MIVKLIHRIAGFVILLTFVFAGVVLAANARSGAAWVDFSSVMLGNRGIGGGLGVALVCIALIYALSAFTGKKKQQYLSFDGEGGTVSISTAAISEYIARVVGEFPSIVKMRPDVIPGRSSIDVRINVQIKDGPDIHEVCELLQKRVREVLSGSLGITDVRKIEVNVKEIVSQFKPD